MCEQSGRIDPSAANNGVCSDGGVGSSSPALCAFGTDCADCGDRGTAVANNGGNGGTVLSIIGLILLYCCGPCLFGRTVGGYDRTRRKEGLGLADCDGIFRLLGSLPCFSLDVTSLLAATVRRGSASVRVGPAPAEDPQAKLVEATLAKLVPDASGRVTRDALGAALSSKSAAEVEALFALLDTDGDGSIDRAELEAGLGQALAGQPGLKTLLAAHDAPSGVSFDDLRNPKGPCTIPDTAERAVTLGQLARLNAHMLKRLGGGKKEQWFGARKGRDDKWTTIALAPSQVNLYDMAKYVIYPSTARDQCSVVELMADGAQRPHYFVSHWWGEAVLAFYSCLAQHTVDRKLDGKSTRYWVCAHANNQHKLDGEISDDLTQTSFFRAMRLAWGTVSVVDRGAVSYSRIW